MTRGTDHELSSVGFTIANGGMTTGFQTVTVFLTSSAVDLARRRAIDVTHVPPLDPLAALVKDFLKRGGRLVALSSQAEAPYTAFRFEPDDWLLFGRETDGLPNALQESAQARLTIPMPRAARAGEGGVRSLNLSVAVGIVLFEALRQLTAVTARDG